MDPNLKLLEAVVERLGPLTADLVFIGGSVAGLLITDEAAPPPRPTTDVDVIVEATTLLQYEEVKTRLRGCGFEEDPTAAHMCRWTDGTALLDVMPTSEKLLGFTNPWYAPAMTHSERRTLPNGAVLRCASAPYFVATKLVAFHDRGKGDYYASHDLEDLTAVVNARLALADEIAQADDDVRTFIEGEFSALIETPDFLQALPGLVIEDSPDGQRAALVLERFRTIARGAS